MSKLILKWKHGYWYYALLSNVLAPLFIVIAIILHSKTSLSIEQSQSFIALCLSSTLIMTLFLAYLYKTTKELRACKELVKKDRAKYLQWGSLSSFLVFNFYLILWLFAYKYATIVPLYVALVFVIIFGFFSSVMLTIYEFCLSFDVFYHQNKEEIIHDFLKNVKLAEEAKNGVNDLND